MARESGYLTIAHYHRIPLRAHWTVPLGALFWTGFRVAPYAWIAFFGLILVHEMGHAVLVRRCGMRVQSVDVLGFGGLCSYAGNPTPWQRSVIAWGGVLAQAMLLMLAATLGLANIGGTGGPSWWPEIQSVLVYSNLLMIAFNLIPVAPLDGQLAWQLPGLYRRRRRRQALEAKEAAVEQDLARTRSARDMLRDLDAREDAGHLPDVASLRSRIVDQARAGVMKSGAKKPMN